MSWFRKVTRRQPSVVRQVEGNLAAGRDMWHGIANHTTHAGWPPDSSSSRQYAAFVEKQFGTIRAIPQPVEVELVEPLRATQRRGERAA